MITFSSIADEIRSVLPFPRIVLPSSMNGVNPVFSAIIERYLGIKVDNNLCYIKTFKHISDPDSGVVNRVYFHYEDNRKGADKDPSIRTLATFYMGKKTLIVGINDRIYAEDYSQIRECAEIFDMVLRVVLGIVNPPFGKSELETNPKPLFLQYAYYTELDNTTKIIDYSPYVIFSNIFFSDIYSYELECMNDTGKAKLIKMLATVFTHFRDGAIYDFSYIDDKLFSDKDEEYIFASYMADSYETYNLDISLLLDNGLFDADYKIWKKEFLSNQVKSKKTKSEKPKTNNDNKEPKTE